MKKELNKKLFFVLIVVAVMLALAISSFTNLGLSPLEKFSLTKNSDDLSGIVDGANGVNLRGTGPTMCYVCDVQALSGATCFGDVDGNGVVNAGDRGYVAVNIGATDNDLVCQYDIDGNGFVNAGDRGYVAVNIGLCTPLPDYQNGNGVNGWVYDPRFDALSCCGNRVCEESNGENSENCLVDCDNIQPVCGNGEIEGDEQCEGSNLNSQTCTSLELGYSGGELGCYPEGVIGECNFDFSGCNRCGDGTVQLGEECDDGNTLNGDGCSASCTEEVIGDACDILQNEFSQIVLATENVVENSVGTFRASDYLSDVPENIMDETSFTWVVKDPQSNFYFDATTTHGLRCDHLGGESDDDNGRNVDYTFEHTGVNQQIILVAEHPGCEEQRAVVKNLNVARNTALTRKANFRVYELVDSAKDYECKGDWREVNPLTHTFEKGERIRFSGSASTGDIGWYTWSFMDGSGGGYEDMIHVLGGECVDGDCNSLSGEFDVQLTVYGQNLGQSSRTTMKQVSCENLGGTYTSSVVTVASDDFSSQGFGGGTGWNGAWEVEGGAEVVYYSSNYQLRLYEEDGYVMRRANVGGYPSLRVSFNGRTTGYEPEDSSELLVSGDGVNWHVIKEFTSDDFSTSLLSYTFDLDLVALGITDEIWIAFDSNSDYSSEFLYIDNVVISSGRYCTVNGNVVPVGGVVVGEGMILIGESATEGVPFGPVDSVFIGDTIWGVSGLGNIGAVRVGDIIEGYHPEENEFHPVTIFPTEYSAIGASVLSLAMSEGLMYLSRGDDGLDVYSYPDFDSVDQDNPPTLLRLSHLTVDDILQDVNDFLDSGADPVVFSSTVKVLVRGDYLYVGVPASSLQLILVYLRGDSGSLELVEVLNVPNASLRNMQFVGDDLIVTLSRIDRIAYLVDISVPDNLRIVESVDISDSPYVEGLFTHKSRFIVSASGNGAGDRIYEVEQYGDSVIARHVGSIEYTPHTSIDFDENNLYLLWGLQFLKLDLSDLENIYLMNAIPSLSGVLHRVYLYNPDGVGGNDDDLMVNTLQNRGYALISPGH